MGNWPLDRSPKAHLKNRIIICKNGFSFARSLNGIVSESRTTHTNSPSVFFVDRIISLSMATSAAPITESEK